MPYENIINRDKADALIPVEQSDEIIKELSTSSTVLSMARRLRNMNAHELELPVLAGLPMA